MLIGGSEHVEIEATGGAYQRMVAANPEHERELATNVMHAVIGLFGHPVG
ncbi:hypothetical protein GCM10010910_27620 [Microbacterium nanhaiense]|uniref:Uncharacterized protein n=1 Tax=Microbacterium nanhaiense TaxID=1301026 RepID=A0ABQ2N521_9MICO|nr:hypothetical protein GCM10010910_27620 [Microbacterium nanhaiense]